ncbi:MAG: sugar ABC transporter substrate-binding protein [Ardenticatenaceae bacterium]|nr:sugar ABC transporter substrate-binding protein [Ardenticatenaceae bacterium]HBY92551.1 D-ribose ABC transporter substrate-binding protein [Chloroflexota bacterium]
MSKLWIPARILVITLTVALLVGACGPTATPAPASAPAKEQAAPAFDPSSLKIGYAVQTLGNPVFTTIVNGGKDAAKKSGANPDNFVVFAAENDLPTQVKQVEDAIQQHLDLLVLHPVDVQGMLDVTKRAVDSGITVVNAGEKMEGTGAIARVVFTECENGHKVGQYVSDFLGEKGGKVVLLDGIVGEFTAVTRATCFLEILQKNPNIELVARQPANYDRGQGLSVMENILQAQPKIDVVYAVNDEMALGALQAISAAGRAAEMIVIGTDGGEEALQSVRDGGLHATLLLPMAKMGYMAVETGIKHLKGETVSDTVEIPTYLITSENVDKAAELASQ